jgi:hypothetical protein
MLKLENLAGMQVYSNTSGNNSTKGGFPHWGGPGFVASQIMLQTNGEID